MSLLALGLVVGTPGGPQFVAAQAPNAELSAARERLDGLYGPLEDLRESLDRSTFDVGSLGLDLAFEEPESIVTYVNEAVRFEPYHGVLRGAQGTLASGGGNALDQAILTAVLLGDAGYEVEIRGAELSDAQVETVLGQLRPDSASDAPELPAVPDIGANVDMDATILEAEARVRALEADTNDVDALLASGLELDANPMQLVEDAARDYYWVAYRLFDGEPWTAAHPVLGATPAEFEGLEATRTLDDEIPNELQHRFRFQVFVERRLGDEVVAAPLTDAWERPVANMYGVPITYANVPDGLEAVGGAGDVGALMSATSFFFPMLDGSVAPGGKAFDMLGNMAPPDAANSPFAAVFQSVAGALGNAVGALGGMGSDSNEPAADAVALTAQWFEFTFIAPGGEEVTHRRMVTDRLGAEARAAGTLRLDPEVSEEDAFAALAGVHTFMLDPGRYAEAYVLDHSLESVLAMRSLVDRALVCAFDGTPPPSMTPEQGALEEPIAPLTLFSTFSDAPLEPDVLSYRPAPAMVVMSQTLDGTNAQVDVVANPRWSLRVDDQGVRFDAKANRRAGVWETRVESLPLAAGGEPVTPALSVLDGLDAGGLRVLESSDSDAVATLTLPYESRAAILDDLANGYSVLLPERSEAASLEDAGWWRVDAQTGETLGRGGDGRGQSFVEYLTSFNVSMAITAGFTVYGVHQCTKIEDPRVAGCCILQNVALAGAGVAAGVGLGIYLGAGKALLVFGIMDIGYNVAGLYIPTVCS